MTRDWKPGDVAAAKHPFMEGEVRGFIDTDGRFYTTDQSVKGISSSCFALSNVRPLVVIDPDDRQQVERLLGYYVAPFDDFVTDGRLDHMQAALREFANPTPPKPDEPTGLYARIEDSEGCVWVRTATQASVWRREARNTKGFRYLIPQDGCETYADLAAVRVLSEGVTP